MVYYLNQSSFIEHTHMYVYTYMYTYTCSWLVALPNPGIEPMSPELAGGFFTI